MGSRIGVYGLLMMIVFAVGSAGYARGNTGYPALALEGNVAKGQVLYQACVQCHLADGSGKKDGSFPQIAGQHASVLIKQLTDIREKRRVNPPMDESAQKLNDNQDLANLVAYVQTLRIPRDNGKGTDDALERGLGQKLYQRDCVRCHGSFGEGNAKKFFPVVAGQHYEYVLRQIRAVKDKTRGNSHPEMGKLVKNYSEQDIKALSNYISLLVWPLRSGN